MLDKDGNRYRPKDCVIGQRAAESLFPRPSKPDKGVLANYGVQERDLVEGWRRAGVLISLAELELKDIYARLIELPVRQPDGKSARSLYHWLLDAADSAVGDGGMAKRQFFREGEMWGHKQRNYAYFPVSELQYADTEGLPGVLLNQMNLVDLRHRSGAEKVKRIFGIDPIERSSIKQRVKHCHLAVDLDRDFQEAKPYLYLLRASQTSQTQHLSTLKNLHLNVCDELTADIEYMGEHFEFQVPVWGWLVDEDVLYVRSDPSDSGQEVSDLLADSIGEAIASIFRIGDGGDFARMFLCRKADRKELLHRMRGEEAEEDMERIIREFGSLDPLIRISPLPSHEEIKEPNRVNGVSESAEEGRDFDEDAGHLPDEGATPRGNDQPLTIEPREHVPVPPSVPRKLSVKRNVGGAKLRRNSHKVTDGDFAERKVVEFEKSADPPRYPLPVGHITGADAPGCDVLSFASPEDCESFRLGKNRSMDKIVRFIEVKGRKSEESSIELRGNERIAAISHKQKYFIYRLYESGAGDYQLSILRAPLDQEEALENAVYISLDQAKATERFSLSGGIQQEFGRDDNA